ncbi:MAG: AHH domain-containing protein, partial [Chloroflexi bacterium]|nr:AHH domain-containing protein [Chloroflexota bacterium]MBV9482870.1 AHH domain-containing protein [Acidobacteriota bacterium]
GGDWDGELGYAATQNCTSNGSNNACGESPAQVTGISGLAQLTGAAWHSLVLKNDGTVWAWGGNWFGELGNGTTTNSTTPVQATGLTGQTLIAAGRDHSMSATGSRLATTAYAYDKLYRLTGATGPSGTTTYSYDPNGNRLSKVLGGNSTSYTYDKTDRILTAGSTTYTVNAAGNVTARGSDAFGFDQANRLTSATTSTGSGTYVYDGDGKRVSKTVAGVTTSYVYDVGGGLPVLLDDGAQKYVWGTSGLAESVNKTSGAVAIYHTDGLGSVRALSDSTGNVTQTYQTDEFGIPFTSGAQGSSTQPFGFTGQQADPENGLMYLRARMYDPVSGRFTQRDDAFGSVMAPQSLSRYIYVLDDPLRLTDPSGMTGHDNGQPRCGDWLNDPIGYTCGTIGLVTVTGALVPLDPVSRRLIEGGAATSEGEQTSVGTGGTGPSLAPVKSSSRLLRRALELAGFVAKAGEAAHHIVAGNDVRASVARDILEREGIGINDAANGVFLPASMHQGVHTNAYFQAINDALTSAAPGTVKDVLADIRSQILAGNFPP